MAKTKNTEPEVSVVFPTITMPYVTDGVLAEVEGTFSPVEINEKSKYVKYGDEYGFFTRN